MYLKRPLRKLVLIAALIFLLGVTPVAQAFTGIYGGCNDTDRNLYLTEPRLSGDDVLELQERLQQLGYYQGKLDGIFGEKTQQAVKQFQSAGKMNVTGQVGPATWDKLSAGIKAPPVITNSAPDRQPDKQVSILIDTNKKTLTLLNNGEPLKTFPCAVGKGSTPTPVGEWKIVHKGGNWGGGFGVRWMGLNVPWGIFGIHGTNKPYSIGSPASHGCIRMFNEHVRTLYEEVEVGTAVKIVGEPKMPPNAKFRKSMHRDAVGPDVVQVQLALKEKGFLIGPADGRFGPATELAVKFLQVRTDMEDTGIVEEETYEALELLTPKS